jgi:hypothetical protein
MFVEETTMIDRLLTLRSNALTLALVITLAVFAAPQTAAQEEPTPVPEEPETTAEGTAPEEPVGEPEPDEQKIPMVYRERTLVSVDGRAEMNGILEFVVQPHGEERVKVRVNVVAKTKDKKIVKELVHQFTFALGDRYKVKQSGDRNIRITAKKKTPPLAVNLWNQQIAGVAVGVGNG